MPARHDPFVGVLMLDTRFPRPPGDIGCPATFGRAGIPVRFHVVGDASVRRVVTEGDPALLASFIAAARRLEADGAALITTSCGFLARWQDALAGAVTVPVVSSSLLLCRELPAPGIVTFDAGALGPAVLRGAGVPDATPVEGLEPGGELHQVIARDHASLDPAAAERDVLAAARALVMRHPAVRHLVLECTNMPPYRRAVAEATGRPVHDIETLVLARWAALSRSRPAPDRNRR